MEKITEGEVIRMFRLRLPEKELGQGIVGKKIFGEKSAHTAALRIKQIEKGEKQADDATKEKLAKYYNTDKKYFKEVILDNSTGVPESVSNYFNGINERIEAWDFLINQIENSPHMKGVLLNDILFYFAQFFSIEDIKNELNEIQKNLSKNAKIKPKRTKGG